MKRIVFSFLIFSLCVVLSVSVRATPISKDEANAFYQQCISTKNPIMKTQSQEAMCACNAAMMMENMSVEDVQQMKPNTEAGRLMLNKMVLEVYTPCMNYPVYDLVEAECLRNDNIDQAGIDMPKENICGCTAEKMAEWFSKDGGELMRIILKEQPFIEDPIQPVMDSKAFKSHSYSSMISCVTNGG